MNYRNFLRSGVSLMVAASVAACAMPAVKDTVPRNEVIAKARKEMVSTISEPIIEVPLAPGMLIAKPVKATVPASVLKKKVDISLPDSATVADLAMLLGVYGVSVGFGEDMDDIKAKAIPFFQYKGDVGGLLTLLRNGASVEAWYDGGILFLSGMNRYAAAVPQHEEVVSTLSSELQELGADNVVTSLRGGQIIYTAPVNAQKELIEPYLNRISRNLAMVSVQVAVVSVSLNDKTASGFDWSAFQLGFDTRHSARDSATGGGTGGGADGGTGGGTGGGNGDSELGTIAELAASGLGFSANKLTSFLGSKGFLSVAGAISFLSEFGDSKTLQNVEVKTLSGTEVQIRSGQRVPYVDDVTNTTTSGSDSVSSGVNTSTVDTGLTLTVTPYYATDEKLVTMEVDIELNSLLGFRELSAGNQVGSITQPETQEQNLNNVVRMQAGSTVVVGGLQNETDSNNTASPVLLRNIGLGDADMINKKSRTYNRSAVFVVLRPTVVVFKPTEGEEAVLAEGGLVNPVDLSAKAKGDWTYNVIWKGDGVVLSRRLAREIGYGFTAFGDIKPIATEMTMPQATVGDVFSLLESAYSGKVSFSIDHDKKMVTVKASGMENAE